MDALKANPGFHDACSGHFRTGKGNRRGSAGSDEPPLEALLDNWKRGGLAIRRLREDLQPDSWNTPLPRFGLRNDKNEKFSIL
jgi:hypothetical protein